jgi:hypothetical protein
LNRVTVIGKRYLNMSCCGSRRAALNSRTSLRVTAISHNRNVASPPREAPGHVALIYSGPIPMVLASPSGQGSYELSEMEQIIAARDGDVAALLLTGWFRHTDTKRVNPAKASAPERRNHRLFHQGDDEEAQTL